MKLRFTNINLIRLQEAFDIINQELERTISHKNRTIVIQIKIKCTKQIQKLIKEDEQTEKNTPNPNKRMGVKNR